MSPKNRLNKERQSDVDQDFENVSITSLFSEKSAHSDEEDEQALLEKFFNEKITDQEIERIKQRHKKPSI